MTVAGIVMTVVGIVAKGGTQAGFAGVMKSGGSVWSRPNDAQLTMCPRVRASLGGDGLRKKIKELKLGRDGEKIVGEQLECMREQGAQVFHDVPAEGFNLDHVVISTQGIYAIETKTRTKPSSKARVVVDGDSFTVAGYTPDRNPIEQVTAAARWLEKRLQESTGKRFFVRGVVVFPGWFVEQRGARGDVWVLEPKALPVFIENAPAMIAPSDVTLAADHLSRYVRTAGEKAA